MVIFPTAGMTVDLVPVADTVREATAVGLTTPGLVPVTWGRESHLLFLFFSSEKKRTSNIRSPMTFDGTVKQA